MGLHGKRLHYQLAKEHLASGDDARLRYAALELRLCLESITYQKLETYTKRLPQEVLRKWQPPQALKALLQFEPGADRNFTLRRSRETEVGVPSGQWSMVGEHHTVRHAWLRENYNRLGSYIHLENPLAERKGQKSSAEIRAALEKIVVELEATVASRMDASFASVISFECDVCNKKVACNAEALEKNPRAVCLDPDCETEYEAEKDEAGEWTFRIPTVPVNCHKCSEVMELERRLIQAGNQFICPSCGARYRIGLGMEAIGDKDGDGS